MGTGPFSYRCVLLSPFHSPPLTGGVLEDIGGGPSYMDRDPTLSPNGTCLFTSPLVLGSFLGLEVYYRGGPPWF